MRPVTESMQPGIGRRGFLVGAGLTGLSLAGIGALAGCAPSEQKPASGKAQVRIASWMQFEPGRKEAWAAIVKKFNAQSKTVEASMMGWPFNQYSAQLLTQVGASSLQADVITAPPDLASRLLAIGALDPIDKAVAEAKVSPYKGMHEYLTKGNDLYGVAVVVVSFALLYNEAVLNKSGFKPATSVDDWVAQAAALTHRPTDFGLSAANIMAEQASFWFQLQAWANPFDGVWAKGKTPMVTSEPIIKTLELYKQMYDKAMPQGTNDAQQLQLMGAGRASQGLVVSPTVNILKSDSPDVYPSLRSVAAPWPSKKQVSRVHPISLYKGAKDKDAAMEFIAWLIKPENMSELMMKSLDVIPPYPELEEKVPEFSTYLKDLPWVDGYRDIDVVTPMQQMGAFINANDEFGNIVLSNFQKSLSSNVPIADAMATAQQALEKLASKL